MKRILIVEDDGWLAENYLRILQKDGYKVAVANNALSAIDAVDDFKPDAIVLDVVLTGSTAFALLHELQSYSDTGEIPVVICTNLAEDLATKNLRPYGVRKVIDKTKMNPDDITVALKGIL